MTRSARPPCRTHLTKLGKLALLDDDKLRWPSRRLYSFLDNQFSVQRLERRLRRNEKKNTTHKVEERSHPLTEEIDPITLEPVTTPAYSFTRPNGTAVKFGASTLADYMLLTGDFRDPTSRVPFTRTDMECLDSLLLKSKIERESCVAAFDDNIRWRQRKEQENEVLVLERCVSEHVSEIFNLIERVNHCDKKSVCAEEEFLDRLMPGFQQDFQLLRQFDPVVAEQSFQHYLSYLGGPPNKPTGNRDGFRSFVIHMLKYLSE